MARNLKAGERLRLIDGVARVESVDAGQVQPLSNLGVAEDHDLFAGAGGVLEHVNTLPDFRIAPFDTAPNLAAVLWRGE